MVEEAVKTTVVLRHKTQYPVYRRAGLVLTRLPEEYQVTAEQLETLEADDWVVIGIKPEREADPE